MNTRTRNTITATGDGLSSRGGAGSQDLASEALQTPPAVVYELFDVVDNLCEGVGAYLPVDEQLRTKELFDVNDVFSGSGTVASHRTEGMDDTESGGSEAKQRMSMVLNVGVGQRDHWLALVDVDLFIEAMVDHLNSASDRCVHHASLLSVVVLL